MFRGARGVVNGLDVAVVDAVQQHSVLGFVVVDAHRFLLLEDRHRIESVDIVDPEDMGGTDLANQIVPLRVVVGLGGQGLVVVIVLVPLREVHELLRDRWTVPAILLRLCGDSDSGGDGGNCGVGAGLGAGLG